MNQSLFVFGKQFPAYGIRRVARNTLYSLMALQNKIFFALHTNLLKAVFFSLRSFPYRRKQGYTLPNVNDGSFISPRTFEYRYKKISKNAKLTPVNYHALRHTFATRRIEIGVDIKSLSEVLGRTNASITLNTYVHSSIELKRVQLEKLVS